MARNGVLRLDAALYLGSAFLAAVVAATTELSTFRVWTAFAGPAYVVAATAALGGLRWDLAKRQMTMAVRIGIAAFMFCAAVVAPLTYEVHARAADHLRMAQAEVYVVEQAAARLTAGHDPYTGLYPERGLVSRPGAQFYFAYLPLILAFGLPSALLGQGPLTDARIPMTLVALAALAAALALWPTTADRRLRLAQVTIVLPSGALFLVTGGDDVAVLALLLLGIVLMDRRSSWAWPVLLACAFLKQTAWPVVMVLVVFSVRDRQILSNLRARPVPALGLAIPGLLASASLALWQPVAFVRAVVLFPLGLTSGPSFDQPPTIGSWVMAAGTAHAGRTAAIVLVVLVLGGILVAATASLLHLAGRFPLSVADLAVAAGLLTLALVMTAPISRAGYLVYPLGLLTLGALMRERTPALAAAAPFLRRLSAPCPQAPAVLGPESPALGTPALTTTPSQLIEEHDVG